MPGLLLGVFLFAGHFLLWIGFSAKVLEFNFRLNKYLEQDEPRPEWMNGYQVVCQTIVLCSFLFFVSHISFREEEPAMVPLGSRWQISLLLLIVVGASFLLVRHLRNRRSS